MTTEQIAAVAAKPPALFDAIGELALAIKPHYMDANQRKRIAEAIGVLVDHILATAAVANHLRENARDPNA
jgi:hypothetical protein